VVEEKKNIAIFFSQVAYMLGVVLVPIGKQFCPRNKANLEASVYMGRGHDADLSTSLERSFARE
jgi:hypothetical protein